MSSNTTFFDSFTREQIARISAAGTRVTLPAQWSPIAERTPADKAYILLDGEMSVRRGGHEVARLGPGDIVGEMALVQHQLRSASIVTLTRVVALHFTEQALQGLLDEVPAFARALDLVVDARSSVA